MGFLINKPKNILSQIFAYLLLVIFLLVNNNLFAQANHLVIGEILIDGLNETSNSGNTEFVEIYNPTNNSVRL